MKAENPERSETPSLSRSERSRRVILTQHARERMSERIFVSERKMQKLAQKAWDKGKPTTPETRNQILALYVAQFKREPRVCKTLMGKVFVFIGTKNPILLTVI